MARAPQPWKLLRSRAAGLAFSTRLTLQQLALVLILVALSAAVHGWLTYQQLVEEVGLKSLSVARSLAEDRDLGRILADAADSLPKEALAAGDIQKHAMRVRDRVGALFVVVTDAKGIRWAHPDTAKLGQQVSTDPSRALAGDEITVQEQGTLGPSIRSKVPIYGPSGQIVGEVSVGYATTDIASSLLSSLAPVIGIALVAAALGVYGTGLLMRALRRHTLGLSLEDIGTLVHNQEAVLHGIEEGVLGISADRKVSVCNEVALELLELSDPQGKTLAELGLPGIFQDLIDRPPLPEPESTALAGLEDSAGPGGGLQLVLGARILIISCFPVFRGSRFLGWVFSVRDRTSVEALTRQLNAVGTLSAALRVQRHEFANRLHAISGMLSMSKIDAAREYLQEILVSGPLRYPLANSELLTDTYLLAFLGAKSTQAAERGVSLRLAPESALIRPVHDAQMTTTILGNLVDNAVTAAAIGSEDDRWVEIGIFSDGPDVHLTVADSGDGIPESVRERLFEEGYRATPYDISPVGRGEGLGLSLSQSLLGQSGGALWVIEYGSPGGPGAVFGARLPGVLGTQEKVTAIGRGGSDGC